MAVTKPNTSFLSKMPYPDTALSSLTPFLLLLLTLLLSIPKLAMAWRITKANTQISLFNNIVSFGLVTSGKNKAKAISADLLKLNLKNKMEEMGKTR